MPGGYAAEREELATECGVGVCRGGGCDHARAAHDVIVRQRVAIRRNDHARPRAVIKPARAARAPHANDGGPNALDNLNDGL